MLRIIKQKDNKPGEQAKILIVGMNHKMSVREMEAYDLVIVADENSENVIVQIAKFKSTDVIRGIESHDY